MELKTTINGVSVTANYAAADKEIEAYINYMCEEHKRDPRDLETLTLKLLENDKVDVDAHFHEQKFERIRRITGYLVGTTDRWNNAKQAELRDRVKHA